MRSFSQLKLPKLTLHQFNGDLTEWMGFWDSYESAIHSKKELSAIDKFNYLMSLLTGFALEVIAGLTLTGPNYDEAIAILQKRFGNRQHA